MVPGGDYFAAYVERGAAQELVFTVFLHDSDEGAKVQFMRCMSSYFPDVRWVHGMPGRAPAAPFDFLRQAVAS